MAGELRAPSRDAVSGSITLEAQDAIAGWSDAADAFLTFVHLGLAFGQGFRLQSPCRELWADGVTRATFFQGNTFPTHLAPILSLNQGPFIEAVARRFFEEPPFPNVLWTAIGWLQSGSTIADVDFLTAMTALETIVEQLAPETRTTIAARPDFAPLRDDLIAVVRASELSDEAKAVFERKIRMLNGRDLAQKLEGLRDHYGLPEELFDRASIGEAIRIRNDLVHRGVNTQGLDVWPRIMFVRDLVALIVFAELGYEGPYEAYHGGYRPIHPPAEGA